MTVKVSQLMHFGIGLGCCMLFMLYNALHMECLLQTFIYCPACPVSLNGQIVGVNVYININRKIIKKRGFKGMPAATRTSQGCQSLDQPVSPRF